MLRLPHRGVSPPPPNSTFGRLEKVEGGRVLRTIHENMTPNLPKLDPYEQNVETRITMKPTICDVNLHNGAH